MEAQYQAGNISLKENIRIQALLFSLKTDKQEVDEQISSLQGELQTLLGVSKLVFIKPSDIEPIPSDLQLDLENLFEKAKKSRADYLSEQLQLQLAQHNFSLQKALAIPDVTIGIGYDQRNSYSPNYWGLSISLPLPFLNRNQGNIKATQFNKMAEEVQMNGLELQIKVQLANALQVYKQVQEFNTIHQQEFYTQHNHLFINVLKSYQQRQISLIEFVDFFESYKSTKLKVLEQRYKLYKALTEINYLVGTSIIN
jgi:cobalt-zinc-cadmium efflux system outer membrane protein